MFFILSYLTEGPKSVKTGGNTERLYKREPQNNKVNDNRIILINNYLKNKWVKCSNQIDWPNGYKNKIPIYAVYKRSTSNLGTELEKNISCK